MTGHAAPLVVDRVEDSATRRQFLAVLGAVGLVSGCAGDDARDDEAAPGERRVVTDAVGREVGIPARPQRIVSLHEATSGAALLSVGAPVVGMVLDESLPERPYDLADVQGVGTFAEPDLEAIALLRPDLIVSYASDGMPYPEEVGLEALTAIAPTVAFAEDVPLEQFMTAVAAVTGRVDEVARQRAVYLEALASLRAAVPQAADLTFVVAGGYDATVYVFRPGHSAPAVGVPQAIEVQVAPVASRPADNPLYVEFSAELMADLRADVILYDSFGAPITESPLWNRLPAVRAGQAHEVPTLFGASYANYTRVIAPLREIFADAMSLRL